MIACGSMRNTPGRYRVKRQGLLEAGDGRQLEGLDAAAVLEDGDQDLDLRACAITVDHFGHLWERLAGAIVLLVSRRHSIGVARAGGSTSLAATLAARMVCVLLRGRSNTRA